MNQLPNGPITPRPGAWNAGYRPNPGMTTTSGYFAPQDSFSSSAGVGGWSNGTYSPWQMATSSTASAAWSAEASGSSWSADGSTSSESSDLTQGGGELSASTQGGDFSASSFSSDSSGSSSSMGATSESGSGSSVRTVDLYAPEGSEGSGGSSFVDLLRSDSGDTGESAPIEAAPAEYAPAPAEAVPA